MKNLAELEQGINIKFKDQNLFLNVFVHRSYLNEHKSYFLPSNEKLEFLGDSVLSLTTSIYLYKNFSHLEEGDYTDIKASVVRTESLADAAKNLGLGSYLQLSKGEERGHGREKTNILADVFEALIAAIFIDQGFDSAFNFICEYLFKDKLNYIVENKLYLSPKSHLQEITQSKHRELPKYILLTSTGPEHKKEFKIAVYIKGQQVAIGEGKSKKQAEEKAAEIALEIIKR